MSKTTLKHLLQIERNHDIGFGKDTHLMIWSPIDHGWLYEDDLQKINPKYLKFLLKQKVVRIGLRNDSPDHIAVFLKDYGKEQNRRIHQKFKR